MHATSDGAVVAFPTATSTGSPTARARSRHCLVEVSKARINGHEPIPLLADVLDQARRPRLNLDVKAANGVAPLGLLLRRMNAVDRVCVSSFSQNRVLAIRRLLGPDLCTVSAAARSRR